jgi:uncharacterized Tic20 family protein
MMSNEEKDRVEVEAEAEVEAEGESVGEVEGVGVDEAEGEGTVEVKAEGEGEVEVEESPEPAETSVMATSQPTQAGPTANERTWAALAHASVLLTFALGVSTGGLAVVVAALVPLGIWLAFRDRSRFVAFHAMQATVFQLASLVVWIGLLAAGLVILIPAWIVTALLLVVIVGLLLLPVALVLTLAVAIALMALPFASLFYGLYGAFEVYGGRAFRYWRVADWIESRGVRIA